MIFKDKDIVLKDGRFCTLRSAQPEDAASLIEYLKVTSAETPYLTREPEEVTLTVEQESAFIQKQAEAKRELMLIATVNGKHVGNCSVSAIGSFKRLAHRCSIGIALYQDYCGLGIGKEMLHTILEAAKCCGYEQAELEVVSTNEAAIALYKKLGFEVYGEQPHGMKYKDGTYADELLMVKYL